MSEYGLIMYQVSVILQVHANSLGKYAWKRASPMQYLLPSGLGFTHMGPKSSITKRDFLGNGPTALEYHMCHRQGCPGHQGSLMVMTLCQQIRVMTTDLYVGDPW